MESEISNEGSREVLSYTDLVKKFALILKPEASFYIIAIIYGMGVSALTLAIPISVQSLVNSVTFTGLTQPLLVLSLVLLGLLSFSGVLNALQTYTTELFQRRFYARMTSEIAIKLANANSKKLEQENGVELVNRYFDIMTVQKGLTALLTGGATIILQTVVGFLLLGVYHPYFVIFDILLIVMLVFVWVLFGKKALISAKMESKAKYATASWLEEMARANIILKKTNSKKHALQIADKKIGDYLGYRRVHFGNLFKQSVILLAIYAVMSSLILGLGGYLVLKGQLTLGQLVAAELVATIILSSFSKAGKHLEAFYDLYAAVKKLSQFYDITQDEQSGSIDNQIKNFDLQLSDAYATYSGHDFKFNYSFEEGKRYLIRVESYSTQLVFLDFVLGFLKPTRGRVELGGLPLSELSIGKMRDYLCVVDKAIFFEGTILENLCFGLDHYELSEVNTVLDILDLGHLENFLADGINEKLSSSGYPLWSSQLIRLSLARVLLSKPKVLIITEVFDQISKERRIKFLDYVLLHKITLILFSDRKYTQPYFDKYLLMDRNSLKEGSLGINTINEVEEGGNE